MKAHLSYHVFVAGDAKLAYENSYTDDLDEAQAHAVQLAAKHPGRRVSVAQLVFSYQLLSGGQEFETLYEGPTPPPAPPEPSGKHQ